MTGQELDTLLEGELTEVRRNAGLPRTRPNEPPGRPDDLLQEVKDDPTHIF